MASFRRISITDGQTSYLATFGAFITVVTLAIGPFSQQVIRYYDCLQLIPGSVSSIPWTNNHTKSGGQNEAAYYVLDGPMSAALNTGFSNPPVNATASIATQCPTGNCTFPSENGASYSSLAMCHSCNDMTNSVTNISSTYNTAYKLPSGAEISGATLLSTIVVSPLDSHTDFKTYLHSRP